MIAKHNKDQASRKKAYSEWGIDIDKQRIDIDKQIVWREHVAVLSLLQYAEFNYHAMSGVITSPNYPAIDVLFKYAQISVNPDVFNDYRVVLSAYINEINNINQLKGET